MVSPVLRIFNQPLGAPSHPLCRSGISASSEWPLRVPLCGQNHCFVVPSQVRRFSLGDSQCGGSVDLEALRDPSNSACSSVHSRSLQRAREFAQPPSSGSRFGMDPLPPSLLGGPVEVACGYRSLRDEPKSSLPLYFSPMSDLQSAGTDAMMQSWDGLQAYAFPSFGLLH